MSKIIALNTYRTSTVKYKLFLFGKRLFDIIASIALIALLLVPFALVAAIISLTLKANPIFVQQRAGVNNKPFNILKFRTMKTSAPANISKDEFYGTGRAGHYIPKFCAFLRRFSIDDLPQLVNVLKGDMSFVGPRPVVLAEEDLLELRRRNGACSVRPGLTGYAQVKGRDTLGLVKKARYDGFYAFNASLVLDVKILLATVGYVLRSRDCLENQHPVLADFKSKSKTA